MTRQPMDWSEPDRSEPNRPVSDQPEFARAPGEGKQLSDAARRALAEAEARRAAYDARAAELARQPEINGAKGPEPVRYGDWENKGVASDF